MSIELIGDASRIHVSVGMYSDGTPFVKGDFTSDDFHTMVLRPNSINEFLAAMFLADSIWLQGGKVKRLVLPFIPGARQDRINPTGDVLFSAFQYAELINTRQSLFDEVIVLDPHSPVAPYYISNVVEYPLSKVAERMWKGYTGIIAPDKGAKKRAEIFAAEMGKPIYYASKNRDVSTGKLSGFSVDIPAGGHYLVVDDICDGGGTFIGLGEKIAEAGSFADLYVTHGIFAKGTRELKKYYKNIYTTDSRQVHERNDVYTYSVVKEMENYNV